ncbi:NAD(P)H-dependent oxidoreductase [uncultured Sphingobacterium sp.]|uniref:NAD(P)H-dependent oxidoreductase n=1 Tax=uncultured Sphingobacterium sp. TaxID=182688 RepID=UPI003748FD13
MSLIEDLNWRYATKKYNPDKKISQQDVQKIVEAARLAPSSYGIQPYKVFAIGNTALKNKIFEIGWNQQIIKDCSHLLVFCAWDNYTAERVEGFFNYTSQVRETSKDAFGSATAGIIASQVNMTPEEAFIDTAKQACIGFAMAIAQAAELKIDNTPMGGFQNAAMDALLGLKEKGLKSVYMLALGYRSDEGDWLVNLKKVRTAEADFVEYID